jgi:hypothetical protein
MSKQAYLILISAVLGLFIEASAVFALTCDKTDRRFSRWALVHMLRHDGFPEVMINEYVDLSALGNIKVNEDTCFTLYVYDTEFSAGRGSSPHGVRRLLVIKNWSYVGMYPIDDVDEPIGIFGNEVIFPDTGKNKNKIRFDREDPPREIQLSGATLRLMKPRRK